jgi:uncharacterized protein (DUF433 family)
MRGFVSVNWSERLPTSIALAARAGDLRPTHQKLADRQPRNMVSHGILHVCERCLWMLASLRALGSSNVSPEKRTSQSTMTEHPRIALAPDVLLGKPVIRGTRLSVEFVIGLMADGWSEANILGNYPGITHDDINACLAMRAIR